MRIYKMKMSEKLLKKLNYETHEQYVMLRMCRQKNENITFNSGKIP
jgi:hypothetical protein